jgi:hypothetical protein
VSEWPKELASKASMGQPIGGSNPSTTALVERPGSYEPGLSRVCAVTARALGRCHGMTKTQRLLAAVALAGAAAGLAAPAAVAAPAAPLPVEDLLPAAAPDMPAAAQPDVQQLGKGLNELNQLNQLMALPDQLEPVIAPAAPALGLLGAFE